MKYIKMYMKYFHKRFYIKKITHFCLKYFIEFLKKIL